MKYVFFMLLLAGCAAAPLAPEEKAKFDHYAVVSLLGDKLPVQFVGTTIFQNKDGGMEIPGWKIDQRVQKDFQAALPSKKMMPIAIDRTVVEELRAAGDTTAKRLLGQLDKEWTDYVFSQAKKAGVRYLFIANRITGHENFPLYPPGFGLFCRSSFVAAGDMHAYLLLGFALWRVEDRKLVFSYWENPADSMELTGKPCAEFSKMDPKKIAAIGKPMIERLLDRAVQRALIKSTLVEK
jgi:hypothetical protein